MSDTYNFQKDLEDSINNADQSLDRKELLVDIFKIYTAKLFEMVLQRSATAGRMEVAGLVAVKQEIISEFRKASLPNIQMSVEQYEALFEKTVEEIMNDAAVAHKGEDSARIQSNLEINMDAYRAHHASGWKATPSGLIVPN